MKSNIFGKKPAQAAPAAPAADEAAQAPRRKKLGKGFIVPVMLLLGAGILVSQIVKQGGSLEDQRLLEEQQRKAREALQRDYETAVDDPLAAAAAELQRAREAALLGAPTPGLPVELPDDADAVLENQRRELDAAWDAIQKRRRDGQASAAEPGGGVVRPGFVGYVAEAKPQGGQVAATHGPLPGSAPDRSGVVTDALAQRARFERELRDQELEGARRAARNSNTNWLEDRPGETNPEKVKTATQIQGRNVLFAGTVVNAVIEQGIDTALPGRLRARVTSDIYDSKTGQVVLVGRGSTLTGQYRSEINEGQERVFAVFDRLITPAGAVVALGQIEAGDQMAMTGIPGQLHTHFWKRMGIATLMAVQSAFVERKVGSVGQVAGTGGQATSSAAGQILLKTTEKELERRYDVPPNITVPAGSLLTLVLQDNVEIPTTSGRR